MGALFWAILSGITAILEIIITGTDVKIEKVVDTKQTEKEYEVKFKGSIWTGVSEEILSNGEIVKIKGFKGNKIILERKW